MVGDRVRARRIELGLTQEQLAHGSGLPLRTVLRIETGASEPRLSTVRALAKALKVNVGVLVDAEQVA